VRVRADPFYDARLEGRLASPLAVELSIGSKVQGRYRIVRRIGAGGMGTVFEVLDERTQRARALKTMQRYLVADDSLRERFEREVTITAGIKSDHIAEVLDGGVDKATGTPFIVMELLSGQDLDVFLKRRGRLPVGDVMLLLSQLARALTRTHAAGVVHRDLKPANLFITERDDGSPQLKVLDFGIAKIVPPDPGEAKTTMALGTAAYMPPEQIDGDGHIGPAADLYAAAHIAFTLLVGEPYWQREASRGASAYVAIVDGCPERASERAARKGVTLPPGFDAWFEKATALDPMERFPSANDLVTALAHGLDTPAPRVSLPSIIAGAVPLDPPKATREPLPVEVPASQAEIPPAPEATADTSDLPTVPLGRAGMPTVRLRPTVPLAAPLDRGGTPAAPPQGEQAPDQTAGTVVSRDVAPLRPRRSAGAIAAVVILSALLGVVVWFVTRTRPDSVAAHPPPGSPSSIASPPSSSTSVPLEPDAIAQSATPLTGTPLPSASPAWPPAAPPKSTQAPPTSPPSPTANASGEDPYGDGTPSPSSRATSVPSREPAPPGPPPPSTTNPVPTPTNPAPVEPPAPEPKPERSNDSF
jgi:serine/threonine protein kinase